VPNPVNHQAAKRTFVTPGLRHLTGCSLDMPFHGRQDHSRRPFLLLVNVKTMARPRSLFVLTWFSRCTLGDVCHILQMVGLIVVIFKPKSGEPDTKYLPYQQFHRGRNLA
jgi:hypothetical protein